VRTATRQVHSWCCARLGQFACFAYGVCGSWVGAGVVAVQELIAAGFPAPAESWARDVLGRYPAAQAAGRLLDLIPVTNSTSGLPVSNQSTGGKGASEPGDGSGDRSSGESADRESKAKRLRREAHRRLVVLLKEMEAGKHGIMAQVVGAKWYPLVSKCGGYTRRHGPCGKLSFTPTSCDFQLCPMCQHRRSVRWFKSLEALIQNGEILEPKLLTLTIPNPAHLTSSAVSDFGKAITQLRRRDVFSDVRGGVRSIETTLNPRNGSWHLHAHVLIDSPFIPHYPQTDFKYVGCSWRVTKELKCRTDIERVGPWEVVKVHGGLAREWTAVCQNFPELKSPRSDFDIDNPDYWYFVDIRKADLNVAAEAVKYIAKGSQIVAAGAGALVEFLMAIKGRRMIQAFGSLESLHIDAKKGIVDEFGEEIRDGRPLAGCCPWPEPECPDRAAQDWEFLCRGELESSLGVTHEFDADTGSYRVIVGAALGGSGPGPDGSSALRNARCWHCRSRVATGANEKCISCGWLRCSCGRCSKRCG